MGRSWIYPWWNLCLAVVICGNLGQGNPAGADSPPLRVAVFRCDMTPPMGQPLISGDLLSRVEDPLWAKGIVLEDGRDRFALCSIDWCELCNSSHMLFRRKIAEAAGTDVLHVAVHTVHQHTAPLVDGDAEVLLRSTPNPPAQVSPKYLQEATDRLAAAVREAVRRLEPFDRVGIGQAKVERVAASRRVKVEGGKIRVRWSTCREPDLRAMPEGHIDPFIKTITLARGNNPLVRLHYYATHPQTPYGDGRASSDFVGHARDRLEKKEGVPQIYFTGCGGDITVGKYNDGSPEARRQLAARLQAGMEAAIAATRFVPVGQLRWRTVPLILPPRTDPGFTEADARAHMMDPKASYGARTYKGALRVAFHQRSKVPFDLSALEIGPAVILNLPGEVMVDFQLYAQQVAPDRFVAVAAYADCATGYICTQQAYAEGGYEPTDCLVAPQSDALLKAAIRRLLAAEKPQQ